MSDGRENKCQQLDQLVEDLETGGAAANTPRLRTMVAQSRFSGC